MDTKFEENLAIGTAGEDIVHPWLVKNNSTVMDMRSFNHTERKGPRLTGTEGNIILPDFAVWNKKRSKGNFAVDVKVKNSTFTINEKLYFSVDDYKLDDYIKSAQIMQLDFVKLIFIHNDRLYVYREKENQGRHYFGNEYGEYGYIFEVDKRKIEY